jgi:hypothetical protein
MTITLATLAQATPQQVFNQVRDHLLKQAKKSKYGDVCLYHIETGAKCAAGCLISNEEYMPWYERNSWSSMVHDFDEVPNAHYELIVSLQNVHDDGLPEHWEGQLKHIATSFLLTF